MDNSGLMGVGGLVLGIVALGLLGNTGIFGGNNRNAATQEYVASEFTQGAISDLNTNMNNGFTGINSNIFNGFSRTNDNLCDVKTSVLTGDMGLQNSILENRYAGQLSACQTQRDILTQTNELNTNLLTTALQNQSKMDECCCSIRQAIREDGEQTRALITSNTIQDLRDRLGVAEGIISNNNVINALAPRSIPAYITSSPYQSLYNGFYGAGFYGNTIV